MASLFCRCAGLGAKGLGRQRQYPHPHGPFAHRLACLQGEGAADRIDAVQRQLVGGLPHSQQPAALPVDGKAARHGFGGEVADHPELAIRRNGELGQQAAGPLAAVEKAPIRVTCRSAPQYSP